MVNEQVQKTLVRDIFDATIFNRGLDLKPLLRVENWKSNIALLAALLHSQLLFSKDRK